MPRNVAFVELASALASMVFPLPGGPARRTPRGGSIPNLEKASGLSIGNSTASLSEVICWSSPPSMLNFVSGLCIISEAETKGSQPSLRTSIMERVS